jgi:hypothetical protein
MRQRKLLPILWGIAVGLGVEAPVRAQGGSGGFEPLPGQKIILKGDSITKGYGFGNYTDPSPLRTVYGIGSILLRANLDRPSAFETVPSFWNGLNSDGTPKTVDTLANELNTNIKQGNLASGDWLIYEDAGQYDMGIHPAPWPWKQYYYLNYRDALKDMVHAVEDVIDRTHIVFMTMFDYTPAPANCQWDKPLDVGRRTANDAIRDEASELGIRVIDMNRIMDAAHEYLQQKGWGRPVGPDGIHPNVYGNYVMALAILGTLGADLAHWKLDPLHRHFAHPDAGGDVPNVWGFTKDPSDSERVEILKDLRDIVVRELAKSPPPPTPPAPWMYPRVVRHGRFLAQAVKQPEVTSRPVSYELGHIYQLDKETCLLIASLREQGGHDFEIGNDAFIFKDLKDIDPAKAIPINRFDPNYRLKTNGKPGVQSRYNVSGGFVPLGAQLADGSPHPAAGTGFMFSDAFTFLPDRSEGHPEAGLKDRDFEFIQLRWDGSKLTITRRDFFNELLGISVGRTALSNSLEDGAGFLVPFGLSDVSGIVVMRYEYDGKDWKPVKAGKPFRQMVKPPNYDSLGMFRMLEYEATIVRDGARFLLHTRCSDFKGRIYESTDGLNFTFLFDHYNYEAPQVLNQGLNGSLYLVTNRGPSLLRNPLLAYPIRGQTLYEPFVIHDERRSHRYDPSDRLSPFIDHATGHTVFLNGRWRHFVVHRVIGVHETDGQGAPPGPHTGTNIVELLYDRVMNVPFRF